ncbi:6-phosphofructo-2-kinase/fructose-2,6-bisphosphatase isoform X2 [Hyalella azteca]|uniref:6-phosphofructo-2-kinase/fructose-2, 6-bisphosphatase isoform X2 n=1 Tax=Hyalella azteca TaxID=294128 RepID=A0A8B7NLP8_HYAAZ|nr:6-phosphofructo-2-kinase/fructose-2,6-bisphosphatase isoform X2 [Hyalella azteca]
MGGISIAVDAGASVSNGSNYTMAASNCAMDASNYTMAASNCAVDASNMLSVPSTSNPADQPTRKFSATTKPFPVGEERLHHVMTPHVVVMVGLPARGKTYMAKKLTRYLNWIGIKTKVFNLGEYRRRVTTMYKNHNFFRSDNSEAMIVRQQCAIKALEDVCKWLKAENGEVAVFDATNTTLERRKLIHSIVVGQMGCKLFYVESICEDQSIIESNIMEVKVNGPDYKGISAEVALKDFLLRIDHYKREYQPLDEEKEDHLSFMKIYNTGEKVVVHKHEGHVQARIVYYLMNIHVTPRSIYLSRHGESMHNVEGRIGGDTDLSNRGLQYRDELANYINSQNIPHLRVWTSWLKRTLQTASKIKAPQERWKALNEIDAGVCEELTYAEIKEKYPADFEARDLDKLTYRYPRGESYEDLIARLEPVIMELERQANVLVVAHQAVLRCLLAYFMDKPLEALPYIHVPLHTVIKLTPVAYGCKVEYVDLQVPSVNTHRGKPRVPGALESPEALGQSGLHPEEQDHNTSYEIPTSSVIDTHYEAHTSGVIDNRSLAS